MHLQLAKAGEAVGGSRYRILGRIGSGGMAEVDLALQTGVAGTSRLCALKRVRKDLSSREEFVAMFFEEARISASLSHPNIVQVYEVGGDEHDCFLAMELLRGRSFAHLQRGAAADILDYRVTLEVVLATLSGLEHAHERRDLMGQPMRLVHRDISPPNVFVTYDGEIKVLDFGVAKSKNSRVRTEAGILKGKVAYMAPELVAGEPLDGRADLYAVGVMLWEATARCERWPGLNEMAILAKLSRAKGVERPGAVANGLPVLADTICLRALEPDPAHRYLSAAQMRADVLQLCEALGGRVGQGQIKDYMARRFASERQREEREIDEALQNEARPRHETEPTVFGSTKRVARPSSRQQPVDGAAPAAPKMRGRWWVALSVALLAGAVLARVLRPAAESGRAAAASPKNDPLPSVAAPAPSVSALAFDGAVNEPVPAASSAKPSFAAPHNGRKLLRSTAPAKPAKAGAPDPRSLQLDRQDPWKE
jgi:serine/threonine-protein kinase